MKQPEEFTVEQNIAAGKLFDAIEGCYTSKLEWRDIVNLINICFSTIGDPEVIEQRYDIE